MTYLVNHLKCQSVVEFWVWHHCGKQGHGASRGNLGEWNDAQEELHPLHPARLRLAEHIATERSVHGPHGAIIFLLLHGEIGLHDLLQRFLLRSLGKFVVGRILLYRCDKCWLPGKFLDLVVRLGNTTTSHIACSPCLTATGPSLTCPT